MITNILFCNYFERFQMVYRFLSSEFENLQNYRIYWNILFAILKSEKMSLSFKKSLKNSKGDGHNFAILDVIMDDFSPKFSFSYVELRMNQPLERV